MLIEFTDISLINHFASIFFNIALPFSVGFATINLLGSVK